MTQRRALVSRLQTTSLAVVLSLIAVVAGSALGPRYGGALTVSMLDLPAASGPGTPQTASERLLLGLRHDTLVRTGPAATIEPSLASSWSAAASQREWTLRLDGAARFHDGQPLTADDAVRSLRRFLASPSPAGEWLALALDGGAAFRRDQAAQLPGLGSLGAHALVLRFTDVTPSPLAPLSALAAAVTGADGAGCGPFVLAHEIVGRRAAFVPFLGHVRGRPFLDQLEVVALGNRPLGARRRDGRSGIPTSPAVADTDRVARLLLLLDPSRPPFAAAPLRRAVARAIDRPTLAARFLESADPLETLLFGGPTTLAQSVPPEGPAVMGEITLAVGSDVDPRASQRLVAHLEAQGLRVTARAEASLRSAHILPEARLVVWCPEVADPVLVLHELSLLAGAPPGFQDDLRSAAAERDDARKRPILERAERALRDEACVIPLARLAVPHDLSDGARGLRVDATGRLILEDAWCAP
jgi:hypothetical protein